MEYRIPPGRHDCGEGCQCGAGRLSAVGLSELSAPTTPEVQAGPSSLHAKVDPSRRVLFRGGTVLSMDRAVGDYAVADVLVTGDTIVEVAPRIEAEATVIDASGMIVMPGFCDPHIHCWQGALGRLIPDNTSSWNEESGLDATPHKTRSYQYVLHQVFAPIYRPEDMYIGTLLTLLGAVSGGITTVCDNAHNSRTPDHSDACITALIDAGIRGVHAYGRPRSGEFRHAFPDDVRRLRNEYFASDDSRLRLRMYMLGRDPLDELEQVVKLRQELDLWISFDSGVGTLPLPMLYRDGWFDGRETINHGNFIDAEQRRLIVDHGTQVNVCPRIEAQFRFGHVPYQDWIDSGLKPAISNDDPATYAINMFSEMQCLYAFQRSKVLGDRVGLDQGPPHLATLREMLEAATIRGAENCGMSDIVGSLTPGKQADIILIDTRTPLLTPINNAFCTVAQGATPGDVNSVMIGGRFVKWNGQLIGYDEPRIFQAAETSREELFARAGWPLETIDVTG